MILFTSRYLLYLKLIQSIKFEIIPVIDVFYMYFSIKPTVNGK